MDPALVPRRKAAEGLKKGKLLFDLQGYKLRGTWTLVKIKKGEKEWLLIKERDGFAAADGDGFPQGSVLSGLTVEELKAGSDPATKLRVRLERLGAPKRAVLITDVDLMLAETRERPFSREGWVFELKYDGYRLLAARERGDGKLLTRRGNDATVTFPEIARAVQALPYDGLILDGEVVALDDGGRPSFDRLQKRGRLTRPLEIRNAAVEYPVTFFAFDLLALEGHDLRPLPLVERKALLKDVLPAAGALRYSDHVEAQGEQFYAELLKMRLEGMVAKKADAPYRGGRSANWVKIRADRTDDFVIVGFTRPKGSRTGFGAVHVADYVADALIYAGRAGSGFTTSQIDEVAPLLEKLQREGPPCTGPIPKDVQTTWVEPKVVCEVRFKEWTEDGLLRQPVFLRFRDDKKPEECVRQGKREGERGKGSVASIDSPEPDPAPGQTLPSSPFPLPHDVRFSNLDKVFWPDEGYTKGDLIDYYRSIGPWLLPYLKDRPVVMTRFPDGINGKSFFQKDAPGFAPDWIRTETVWSEDTQRELNYFVCDSEEALLYIINLGTIPLHVWSSRVGSLERPDWCILDLDPKDAPFLDVITIARAIRELCDEIGLPSFIKTSGSSGLHVLLPLARQCTYEQSRTLGQLLARAIVADHQAIATITRSPSKRGGKVYLDYVQNGHGRLLVAPFSARPLPGAPVSMPLAWREVGPKLDIKKFTIRTALARLQRLKADPLRDVLDARPDLPSALERLKHRFDPVTPPRARSGSGT